MAGEECPAKSDHLLQLQRVSHLRKSALAKTVVFSAQDFFAAACATAGLGVTHRIVPREIQALVTNLFRISLRSSAAIRPQGPQDSPRFGRSQDVAIRQIVCGGDRRLF